MQQAKKIARVAKLWAAIKQLESLDNRYPFVPYSQQVQLDLIYAYYKSAELPNGDFRYLTALCD